MSKKAMTLDFTGCRGSFPNKVTTFNPFIKGSIDSLQGLVRQISTSEELFSKKNLFSFRLKHDGPEIPNLLLQTTDLALQTDNAPKLLA